MAGPGIRAWEIARSLADEFPVVLAAPSVGGDDAPGFRVVAYARDRRAVLSSVLRDARLVVVQGTVLALSPWIADTNVPLVVDLYDPFHLESLHLFSAARRLRSDYPRLKVFFMGTRRPGGGAAGAVLVDAAQRLTRELRLEDVVLFNDWVDYRDRQNFLLESDVGISLSKDHLENT